MLKINSKPHSKRFPYWLRQSVRINGETLETRDLLRDLGLNTVCQSAQCPNIYDCFSKKKCTFLILGKGCTRSCRFCAIETGKNLGAPDKREFFRIRNAVERLKMRKVVITSVTRDDLEDGGAGHFADCIGILRRFDTSLDIEVLVPDFLGNKDSIDKVLFAKPNVFSHNIETVPRLYKMVRPQADYKRSLSLIEYVKTQDRDIVTKSGLMVGFGEARKEVYNVMQDLKKVSCDIITIGQYLKPGSGCLEVKEFLEPTEFDQFSRWAGELGFNGFSCTPFTRSSSFSFNPDRALGNGEATS